MKFSILFFTPLIFFFIGFVFSALLTCNTAPENQSKIVILNAAIWTANENNPFAEAIAITGKKITAVGTNAEIKKFIDDKTQVIDAKGKMIVPGFIDSHLHLLEGGFRLSSVQLRDANTKEIFVSRIADFAKSLPPGVWITGGDWDHSLWGGELPTAAWIDSMTPENPVWINRLDGHMALANSKAMQIAKINAATQDIPGGTIVRDSQGNPTGIFKDNAMSLVEKIIPEADEQMEERALQIAMDYLLQNGVTSVHTMGTWDEVEVYQRAHQKNLLKTRIYAAVPMGTFEKLNNFIQKNGRGDEWLKLGALKAFVDGSLGSHTAAFFEPFDDSPGDSGLLVTSPEELYQLISAADSLSLQAVVHAIGDRANHILLEIYEKIISKNRKKDRRFRIEHAQHLRAEDIPRFAKLGVIASMQPYHLIDDGRWAEKIIGYERAKTTYAFKSLLDHGAKLAFGSDWFVAPPNPIAGIYAAVTRRTLDNKHPKGWILEQKITVEQALRAYTIDAAYASFDEKIKGSLESGKLADLVLLDQNLFAIPEEQIKDVNVEITIINGKIMYQNSK